MENDDYELLPHSELKKMEREIQNLKVSPDTAPNSFRTSMDDLSGSLKSMIQIFSEAKNELRLEDEEKELLSKKIGPMTEKLDRLLDQNEKIAEAILSVADMIKKLDMKVDRLESMVDEVSPPQKPQYSASSQLSAMQRSQPQSYQQPRPMQQQQPQYSQRPQMPAFGSPAMTQGMPQSQSQMSQRPLDQDLLGEFQGSGQESQPMQSFSQPASQFSPSQSFAEPQTTTEEMFKPEGMTMPPPPPPAPKKGFFGK